MDRKRKTAPDKALEAYPLILTRRMYLLLSWNPDIILRNEPISSQSSQIRRPEATAVSFCAAFASFAPSLWLDMVLLVRVDACNIRTRKQNWRKNRRSRRPER